MLESKTVSKLIAVRP